MKTILCSILAVAAMLVCSVADVSAQQVPNPRVSPTMIAATKIDNAYIKVVYGMPFKRDRVIFGELVPYGEVWRAGANEATEITLTSDMTFSGTDVPAGHYALFVIPAEKEWTIIFNSELGQWGSFNYKQEHDVVRFNVPVERLDEEWEAFRILLVNEEGNTAMQMRWDRTGVTIPFSVK